MGIQAFAGKDSGFREEVLAFGGIGFGFRGADLGRWRKWIRAVMGKILGFRGEGFGLSWRGF